MKEMVMNGFGIAGDRKKNHKREIIILEDIESVINVEVVIKVKAVLFKPSAAAFCLW